MERKEFLQFCADILLSVDVRTGKDVSKCFVDKWENENAVDYFFPCCCFDKNHLFSAELRYCGISDCGTSDNGVVAPSIRNEQVQYAIFKTRKAWFLFDTTEGFALWFSSLKQCCTFVFAQQGNKLNYVISNTKRANKRLWEVACSIEQSDLRNYRKVC